MNKTRVSVVIPLYNEQESLRDLHREISAVFGGNAAWDHEVIFVDDGSTDGSFAIIRELAANDPRLRGIRFKNNSGKAAALAAGFREATGDYVITMDADLQDDPAEIPDLIRILEGGVDLVSGWKKKRLDPLEKRLPSRVFNAVTSLFAGIRLHDFNCGLKAYRAAVVKKLYFYGEMHRYLPALAHWEGFRVTEKAVQHRPRKFGKSKYGLMRYFYGFFDLVTISFLKKYMRRPLHFFGILGFIFFVLGCVPLAYFGAQWFLTRALHIRPLLLLGVGCVIMAIQFFSIGLLGEMITYFGKREDAAIAERAGFPDQKN